MTDNTRALLEQALEVLTKTTVDESRCDGKLDYDRAEDARHAAIDGLRAELEKPSAPAWHDAPETIALRAERDELLKLLKESLAGMEYSIRWQQTGDGRPPSQVCFFTIQDVVNAIAKVEGGAA